MTGSATACSIGAPGEAESDGSARRRGARGYAVYVRKMEGTVVSCVWGEGRGEFERWHSPVLVRRWKPYEVFVSVRAMR